MIVRSRAPFAVSTIIFGCIALLALGVALWSDGPRFGIGEIELTTAAAVAIALVAANAISIRGLRMRRTGIAAEAIFLDIPIAAPLFSLHGAVGATAAATALAIGFAVGALYRRGHAGGELLRHGIARTLLALALVPFAPAIQAALVGPEVHSVTLFTLGLSVLALGFAFLVSAPIAAVRSHIFITRIWARVGSDPRFWAIAFGGVLWSVIVHDALLDQRPFTVLELWLAVVVVTGLIRANENYRVEVYRLRLVRDAVQAMLGARDPLPQINAMLSTLHTQDAEESLSVFAATHANVDDWSIAAALGPEPSPAGAELRKRALAHLKHSNDPYVTLRDDYYVLHAFASRVLDADDLVGAILLYRRHGTFAGFERHQFEQAAQELAPLLFDLRIIASNQTAATTDSLTGLSNRAAIMQRLDEMLSSDRPRGAVLMLDIDYFKRVNDLLGHATGDMCLRRISEIIVASIRDADVAGRIGGEEFLVVMSGASNDIAFTVGERLRLAVNLSGLRHADGEAITISIGAATARPGDTPEALLERADRALYEAKDAGRNRLIAAAVS